MFDPSLSIYATMVLSNLTKGINVATYKCGPLYITVDSEKFILMNWDFKKCAPRKHPDTIKLYTFDERNEIVDESIPTEGNTRSYHKSKFQLSAPFKNFPQGWNIDDVYQKPGKPCLPFVIESSRNGRVVDRRCLRIFPSWMKVFGELRIGEMFIPGTHNSGAYTGVPSLLMTNYVLNQDRSLYEQLVFGQRYFDIRVGISSERKFRITHSVFQTSHLDEELDNIAKFVQKSPKEIIILDIHKFNIPAEFTKEEHEEVLKLINDKVGQYVIPKTAMERHKYGPKLKTLWSYNKSIIIAYKEPSMVEKHLIFWPAIERDWGNKIEEKDLLDYMISVARSKLPGNPMRVLMAELTPNLTYIMGNPVGNLGLLADLVNRNLTLWIRDNKLYNNINLIATDFFLGNRLVEYSIGINNMKLAKRKRNYHDL